MISNEEYLFNNMNSLLFIYWILYSHVDLMKKNNKKRSKLAISIILINLNNLINLMKLWLLFLLDFSFKIAKWMSFPLSLILFWWQLINIWLETYIRRTACAVHFSFITIEGFFFLLIIFHWLLFMCSNIHTDNPQIFKIAAVSFL